MKVRIVSVEYEGSAEGAGNLLRALLPGDDGPADRPIVLCKPEPLPGPVLTREPRRKDWTQREKRRRR